jgi:hypothetical protein
MSQQRSLKPKPVQTTRPKTPRSNNDEQRNAASKIPECSKWSLGTLYQLVQVWKWDQDEQTPATLDYADQLLFDHSRGTWSDERTRRDNVQWAAEELLFICLENHGYDAPMLGENGVYVAYSQGQVLKPLPDWFPRDQMTWEGEILGGLEYD